MKLIGVTGTDGKTTTTSIIYQLINSMSKCGYIGTNGVECAEYSKETHLTTPLPKDMFESLDNFYKNDCKYVAMEVSSEGLRAKRLDSMTFDVAIFTNLQKIILTIMEHMKIIVNVKVSFSQ
jgi:UDP-N-acetylmuramoyl-L-alanyl-D-glutamate--2,6-diaminopimelate ligase